MTDATTALVLELLQTQKTLTLATADPQPWSAPVYYVYRKGRFYFFSSPNSRHVAAALVFERCAGSIFRDSDDWRAIEGLQMEGKLESTRLGAESIGAFHAYVKKFPTVKDFFAGAAFDLSVFRERFRTQLYAFLPERIFYMNNQTGLGKRREIQLPA